MKVSNFLTELFPISVACSSVAWSVKVTSEHQQRILKRPETFRTSRATVELLSRFGDSFFQAWLDANISILYFRDYIMMDLGKVIWKF